MDCRVLLGVQRSRLGVRIQREPAGSDLAYLRPERVLLPPERDLLHSEERVHGLGQARAEPAQRPGRDARGNGIDEVMTSPNCNYII